MHPCSGHAFVRKILYLFQNNKQNLTFFPYKYMISWHMLWFITNMINVNGWIIISFSCKCLLIWRECWLNISTCKFYYMKTAKEIITVSYRTSANTKPHGDQFLGRKATIHSTSLIRHTYCTHMKYQSDFTKTNESYTLLWIYFCSFLSRNWHDIGKQNG